MIFLYSGTPRSGKSLHVAERLYHLLRAGRPVVCNFNINLEPDPAERRDLFHYKSNLEITPEYLIQFSQEHFKGKRVKESPALIVDECQLRSTPVSEQGRTTNGYLSLLHRHYGYDIILIACLTA